MRRRGVDASASGAEIDQPVLRGTAPPDQTRNDLNVAKTFRFSERSGAGPGLAPFLCVEDANGVALGYPYFEEDQSRRALVNRLSGADAKAGAQTIARALTVATKSSN